MLIIKSLHKYLFSLTLVLSLVSFSGFAIEQQPTHVFKIELLIEPSAQSKLFYTNFCKTQNTTQNYSSEILIDTISITHSEKNQHAVRLNKVINYGLSYTSLLTLIEASIG